MKLAFSLWSLSRCRGGTERSGAALVNHLASQGHEVVVFTYGEERRPPVCALDASVRLEYFSEQSLQHRSGLAEARRVLRAHAPDAFIAMDSSASLARGPALARGTGIPLILSERNDPVVIERERWNRPDRLAVFSGADGIHLLLESARQNLPVWLRERVTVIPNCLDMTAYAGPENRQKQGPFTICTVGRLADKQKQQSLLIRAFALLAADFPDWNVRLYGADFYGERAGLEALVAASGLSGRVLFMGELDDVRPAYKNAHIFCLPSRHEGFSVALLEAMRHSLPVAAFAACRGLADIVDTHTGILAGDMSAQGLADALRALMADSALRERMGKAALHASMRYHTSVVYPMWEDFIRTIAAKRLPAPEGGAVSSEAAPFGRMRAIRRVESRLIEDSGLFQQDWYREHYVRGPEYMRPLEHYLRFGAQQGKNPGPGFDTVWYRRTYMQREAAEMNPLVHYILWGRAAGYAPSSATAANTRSPEAADDVCRTEGEA